MRSLSSIAQRATTDYYSFPKIFMNYVYIIQSINNPEQTYAGITRDLQKRLANHNSGTTSHTRKYMPWKLYVYLGFVNKTKAIEFEKYLKLH